MIFVAIFVGLAVSIAAIGYVLRSTGEDGEQTAVEDAQPEGYPDSGEAKP